jgi:FHS family L-fucose permease-like MFS transporter
MKTNRSQLYSIIIIFFFWGFIAASNGILIPFCKAHLSLSQFQSQLIDFTFYGGYFIGSVLLFLYNRITGTDLLNKIGLKHGIIYGLLCSAAGALLIIPSVYIESYPMILSSYFLIALGFSLQQTCVWPYIIALGSSETGAHRSNLAGAVNSFGTTIGPIILSFFLFGGLNGNAENATMNGVAELFIGVTILFIALAIFFRVSHLPEVQNTEELESGWGALGFPQLKLGMLAIFIYVGVEVTIQSNLGALLKLPEFGGYEAAALAPFISMYWGSLMIGRWTGALAVFEMKGIKKIFFQVIVPFIAFGIVLVVNQMNGHNISPLSLYWIPVLLMIIMNLMTRDNQVFAMIGFSLFGLIAMIIGLLTTGTISVYAFLSGGLACSVLWPCIFSLSIQGLGKYTSQGSAFLIMMILGGAILPPIQGLLADHPSIGIHHSYIIPLLGFVYLVWFGYRLRKPDTA